MQINEIPLPGRPDNEQILIWRPWPSPKSWTGFLAGGAPQIHDPVAVIETTVPIVRVSQEPSVQADALSALGNLGYGPGEAAAIVAEIIGDMAGADAPTLIRAALKKLAPMP